MKELLSNLPVEERILEKDMLGPDEILEIARSTGVKVHDLLRPSSPVYKENKEKLLFLSEEQLATVIANHPNLIKRPILKKEDQYVVGFDMEKIGKIINH